MSYASLPTNNGPVTKTLRNQLLAKDRLIRHNEVSRKLHNNQQWSRIRNLYRVRMQRIGVRKYKR